ncbi:uncharacterized protein [Antedon mediterranea]|uniref:uncharacterized protein n=1 Tax=Antedon mediterranea TaxID=105859 RepID=UPI003AF7B915
MSLRTKINGFTAWVNFRLQSYDHLLNNVIMDLLKGTNLKMLIQSLTGVDNKKLKSFDGLTQQQKVSRMEWVIGELKENDIIPVDVFVDCRLFAMRHAEHVFDLLWRLVCHDIWFTWERLEYLLHKDDKVLTEVPFEWIPKLRPEKSAKKKKAKVTKSLLSGFGSGAVISESLPSSPEPEAVSATPSLPYTPFPGDNYCKKFKPKNKMWPRPDAEDAVLEMINAQLQTSREGRKLHVQTLDDLVDSRVLCALVNCFAPGTFTTEVMLNDRWTINLALRTYEKIMRINTPLDSQDLVEADEMAICSTFCVYFMCGFKLRQSRSILARLRELDHLLRAARHEVESFPEIVHNVTMLKRRKELKNLIAEYEQEKSTIGITFDIEACKAWWEHVNKIQIETREIVSKKMKERFDTFPVPRSITISDLCLSMVINLNLSNGLGFYLSKMRETVNPERKIVLKNIHTGEFMDDFTQGKSQSKATIRSILGLPSHEVLEINPSDYPQYEMYFESLSRNKSMKTGTVFLYQVFPGNFQPWENLFFKAAKLGELNTIQKLVVFFKDMKPNFINAKEKKTLNTALHMAARNGNYDVALYLLESGCNIDTKNYLGATPFFNAVEGLSKGISQDTHENTAELLVEWGANVFSKNKQSKTAFDSVRNEELKQYLISYHDHLQTCIPKLMRGNTDLLQKMVEDHVTGVRRFSSLRSRCINGSTLLHTATYFGAIAVVKELLKERVDVNLHDYKGATPLHRANNAITIKILLENGADINSTDGEGNTTLHVKCYGEASKATEIDCLETLMVHNISLIHRNNQGLLALHCCAMQGRIDAIEYLLGMDTDGTMLASIKEEDPLIPPSLPHLALANDYLDCAKWLVENGFTFKDNEQDVLVHRILTEQIQSKRCLELIEFLFEQGADLDQRYPGGNTPLHYAAGMLGGSSDIMGLLLQYGAEVDAVNDDNCTPLFFATQANNQFATSVLLANGANIRHRNKQGTTPFDCIVDFDDWLECGFFTDEVKARLKAYSLKHARDLVRAITNKVKGPPRNHRMLLHASTHHQRPKASYLQHTLPTTASLELRHARLGILPPLKSTGFLTY